MNMPSQLSAFRKHKSSHQSMIPVSYTHLGDRAVRMALDALEKSKAGRRPDDTAPLHNRIEHAQLVSPVDLRRFASLDVIASIQPIHATSDRYMADKAWGARSSIGSVSYTHLGYLIVCGM